MNRTRIGLAVLLVGALAVGYSLLRNQMTADSHRQVRQLIVHYALKRFDNPIVVLGDSNSEASTLPRMLCGHPIVNAGLNGASTASDLGTWLIEALDGKRAAAIVVSLGTNDALGGRSAQQFQANYSALLAQLAKLTPHLFVLAVPPIDVLGRVTVELQKEVTGRIDDLNSGLPGVAARSGATFIALPSMPTPHTVDGLHLDGAGYSVWEKALLEKVSGACNSN